MTEHIDIELAAERQQLEYSQIGQQYIVVQIAGAGYALPITSVSEVEHVPRIASVPGSPDWVLGVVNLRGSILTLVDTARLLGAGSWQPSKDARMLVVGRDDPAALAVDRLTGMRRLTDISRSPSVASLPGRAQEFVTGVHHSEGDWLSVLDINRLLEDADRQAARAGGPTSERGG